MLARRSGLEQPVVDALAHAYERWDGKGFPAGLEGDAVPLAVRIASVARDADLAIGLGERRRGSGSGSEEAGHTTLRWSPLSSGWGWMSSPSSTAETSGRPLWRASRSP